MRSKGTPAGDGERITEDPQTVDGWPAGACTEGVFPPVRHVDSENFTSLGESECLRLGIVGALKLVV